MADKNLAALWDQRKAKWQLLVALRDADNAFGAHATAYRVWDEVQRSAIDRFGTVPRAKEDASEAKAIEAGWEALSEAETAWYSDYVHPADLAAIGLVLTPAPDLEAVLLKAKIAKDHELDNTTSMPREPMDVILDDVRRLDLTNELA